MRPDKQKTKALHTSGGSPDLGRIYRHVPGLPQLSLAGSRNQFSPCSDYPLLLLTAGELTYLGQEAPSCSWVELRHSRVEEKLILKSLDYSTMLWRNEGMRRPDVSLESHWQAISSDYGHGSDQNFGICRRISIADTRSSNNEFSWQSP